MATRTARPNRSATVLWALALLGVGLLGIVPISLLELRTDSAAPLPALPLAAGESVAYIEFGRGADTVWLASTETKPGREKLLTIEHALDFGVVAALAPDGKRFAFTALPPATRPSPSAPAQLWLAPLVRDGTPAILAAGGADLLIRPVWAPDGGSIVFRRSTPATEGAGDFRLVVLDLATGTERDVVASQGAAVFPVAFAPEGDRLYYVRVREDASDLLTTDLGSVSETEVARLAEGLTRDWALSPAGDRLAYLEMAFAGGQIRSRAYVLDLATGLRQPVSERNSDEFSPVWSAAGDLVVGRLQAEDGGSIIRLSGDGVSSLPRPARGFDVPLAWSASGALAVRSFEGSSAMAPGRPALTVVLPDGARRTIATGEVSFLGWTTP